MERFKESRIVGIIRRVGLILGLLFFVCMVLSFFGSGFLVGFFILPVSVLCILVADLFSRVGEYTGRFMVYIGDMLGDAVILSTMIKLICRMLQE